MKDASGSRGSTAATVDEYLAGLTDAQRAVLEPIRAALRDAFPQAEEMLSYKMPAFKLEGVPLLFFAAWKRHYSIYPVTEQTLPHLDLTGILHEWDKGTLRFPYNQAPPLEIILQVAKLRSSTE